MTFKRMNVSDIEKAMTVPFFEGAAKVRQMCVNQSQTDQERMHYMRAVSCIEEIIDDLKSGKSLHNIPAYYQWLARGIAQRN